MNHIENIEIKNFKSIKHASIKDCRRVNVFIGYPNVGKSNILEAMSFLSFINRPRPVGLKDLVRVENFSQIFHFSKVDDGAYVKFNERYDLAITYIDEASARLFLTDSGSTKEFLAYNPDAYGIIVTNGSTSGNPLGDNNDFIRNIQGLDSFFVKPYKFVPSQKFSYSHSVKNLEVPNGYNLNEVIINNPLLLSEISKIVSASGISLVVDQSTREIRYNIGKSQDILYTLSNTMIADTLQRLIFHKAAILSNKESVLLFEEPEAHMFPPYISKFTSEVTYDENGNQFFIATHSPYVVNDFTENLKNDELAIFTVGYDKEIGETLIRKMDDKQMHEMYQYGVDIFLNLENFLPNAEQQ